MKLDMALHRMLVVEVLLVEALLVVDSEHLVEDLEGVEDMDMLVQDMEHHLQLQLLDLNSTLVM